jgi:hypothetical protein
MVEFLSESEEEYRARAKDNLTSHALADYRRCPALYLKKHIKGEIQDEDRPAYALGRAAHTLILQGERAYAEGYAFGGPTNPKTGRPFGSATKAWQEWADQQGKPVLDQATANCCWAMHTAVKAHPVASVLLSTGTAEAVARIEYRCISCQARVDWISDRYIVDLKTCDDLTWFESDSKRYGYAHQMAFYRSVVEWVCGQCLPVYLIAVEKKEPYRCGVWLLGDNMLSAAQQENEAAIERLKKSRAENHWPTGYEETRVMETVA